MLRFQKRGAENAQRLGDLPLWLSGILRNRGVDTEEKAARFLSPDLDQLHDPMLLEGMDRAVEILTGAIQSGDRIQIYGDYDCDGVCASAIMLETLRELGAQVDYHIPSRHQDGYGLNCDAVRRIAEDHRVLLTVDCGVTNHEEVRLAQLLGMTVIVTDHHQLADTPSPADVVLNPLCGDYPFRRLCGAGVALKLTHALGGMEAVLRRIDLAALATVADLVPLIDENRVIVREGLRRMEGSPRPGLAALITLAGVTSPVSSSDVGYRLAPRINAGGRLEDAAQCVEMLTSCDRQKAESIALHLHQSNETRQAVQTEITQAAEKAMREEIDFFEDRAIIIMGEEWNSGVIGLAAGRICEKYHFPTIVLSQKDGVAVGSCRSIPGVNIHAMLCTCQDLFMRFGGHEQAAGLTMRADLVPELRRRLNLSIREKCEPACFIPAKEYDETLPLPQVDLALIERLEALEPTGYGNPSPVFRASRVHVQEARPVGKNGDHLKLTLLEDGALRDGIAFQMGSLAASGLETVDVLYSPEKNEYRGRVSAQVQVQGIRVSEGTSPLPGQDVLFTGLLQEMQELAANPSQIVCSAPDHATEAGVRRLLEDGRGTLLIAHERERAMAWAMEGRADAAVGQVQDMRAFSTVLAAPQLGQLMDVWHDIVLLDGDVLPGEAAAICQRCPRARLHALKPNPALRETLASLALTREQVGTLYRRLTRGGDLGTAELVRDTGLTFAQVVTGLTALSQVELVSFSLSPYALRLLPRPMENKNLDDSSLLRYVRSLG